MLENFRQLYILKPLIDIESDISIFNKNTNSFTNVKKMINDLLIKELNEINIDTENLSAYDKLNYLEKTFNNLNIFSDQKLTEHYFNLSKKTLLMGIINCNMILFLVI